MNNKELLEKFYNSFSDGNAQGMIECYHKDITFRDPAFGKLRGSKAKNMWEMLLSKKDSKAIITYKILEIGKEDAKVSWTAHYKYGPKKRNVINKVIANFEFRDGKIINHTDKFDLWSWSKQALGASGYLLGWSSYMRDQIQKKTGSLLNSYIEKKSLAASVH
ncbi:ketosteroid isomerase-like protein [Gillisia mitskevichiae]|uniref:Ketosteroid isomerase-like protein n=1 Tax=Gillisia mitskevichiae TaxID=270921 RepID=A0A495PVL7_9FLAO|nr:nuclear transport factor 2 family protein [Gillisia mitskevichiae]RKS53528.1 ketosteroid isomerase-like protein [Gillisia mitskevichiae]